VTRVSFRVVCPAGRHVMQDEVGVRNARCTTAQQAGGDEGCAGGLCRDRGLQAVRTRRPIRALA
jgi:hypothetical protein